MLISFLFLDENICCGYSLEMPRRGASNEYPQHMFSSRNKNIMWIPPLICSYDCRTLRSSSKVPDYISPLLIWILLYILTTKTPFLMSPLKRLLTYEPLHLYHRFWMCRPTADQEVAGSAPAEFGNILSWRLIMKYFLRSFSPFR